MQAEQNPVWSYVTGLDNGPENWGDLDPSYGECSAGTSQSPININDLQARIDGSLRAIEFRYMHSLGSMLNEGGSLRWAIKLPEGAPSNNTIRYDGREYVLRFARFHTPSEHRIRRLSMPMEVQLFHETSDAQLERDAAVAREGGDMAGRGVRRTLVLSALVVEGNKNKAILKLSERLPSKPRETVELPEEDLIYPDDLLPLSRKYFVYEGSRTQPPCTQDVTWIVFQTYVQASAEQIRSFRDIMGKSSRPLQPLGNRTVRRYHGKNFEVTPPPPKPDPKGPPGPRGPRGRQGPPGETGPKGVEGPRGPQGYAGRDGKDGAAGPEGPKGVKGVLGPRGEKGLKGETGAKGETGPVGPRGPDGRDGLNGANVPGPEGPRGPPGEEVDGPEGPKGQRGPVGAKGQKGDQGPEGDKGPPGDAKSGPEGVEGPQGDRGARGRPGAKGPKGTAGKLGEPGPEGPRGPTGYRGAFGPAGPKEAEFSATNIFGQALAESTCASLATVDGMEITAVMREVVPGSRGLPCAEVCNKATQGLTCFASLHVYKDFKADFGLAAYRYNNCVEGNFCCCHKKAEQ